MQECGISLSYKKKWPLSYFSSELSCHFNTSQSPVGCPCGELPRSQGTSVRNGLNCSLIRKIPFTVGVVLCPGQVVRGCIKEWAWETPRDSIHHGSCYYFLGYEWVPWSEAMLCGRESWPAFKTRPRAPALTSIRDGLTVTWRYNELFPPLSCVSQCLLSASEETRMGPRH